LVSVRTRITASPFAAWATADCESKTTLPTAAPGLAPIPVARRAAVTGSSKRGNISSAGPAPLAQPKASSIDITPSSNELGGDPERGGGTLAHPRLQHPQLPALNGELDIAQVRE
jgi:hypothetical protein